MVHTCISSILISMIMLSSQAAPEMPNLGDKITSFLESKVPNEIADDEDLTSELCPSIGETPLATIYEELRLDPLVNYLEADGYDILSIERHSKFGTTELRILRSHSNSECSALLFNKHL